MANEYDVGTLVRASVTFRDLDGVPTDPDTVNAKYQEPDGTEVEKVYDSDPEVVRDGVGRYHIDITLDASGTWYARFEGTEGLIAGTEWSFVAKPTVFS